MASSLQSAVGIPVSPARHMPLGRCRSSSSSNTEEPPFVASYGEPMPQISIDRSGCRSCSLCHDVCPTKVFDLDDQSIAVPARPAHCIGCTSCESACPSRCLEVTDVDRQRPFYRIEENVAFVAKFLRRRPVQDQLSTESWQLALRDVATRLTGLADSITETMGRGQKAVGRKAGRLAAEHMPEMYEGRSTTDVLDRLQRRFRGAFDYSYEVE